MKTNAVRATSFGYLLTTLLAYIGMLALSHSVTAQDAAEESRRKAVTSLKAAREIYLNEVCIEDEKLIRSDLNRAEQSQRTAKNALEAASKLAAKGIITPLQLESAASEAEKKEKLREVAQAKLKSLLESKEHVRELFDRLERVLSERKGK